MFLDKVHTHGVESVIVVERLITQRISTAHHIFSRILARHLRRGWTVIFGSISSRNLEKSIGCPKGYTPWFAHNYVANNYVWLVLVSRAHANMIILFLHYVVHQMIVDQTNGIMWMCGMLLQLMEYKLFMYYHLPWLCASRVAGQRSIHFWLAKLYKQSWLSGRLVVNFIFGVT